MTNPVLEDDVVERLRIKSGMITMGEKIPWGSETALMEEAAALIERLQKELGEAKEAFATTVENCRAKTIEDCAKVAENRVSSMQTAADAMAMNIANAIRSMDGGGK